MRKILKSILITVTLPAALFLTGCSSTHSGSGSSSMGRRSMRPGMSCPARMPSGGMRRRKKKFGVLDNHPRIPAQTLFAGFPCLVAAYRFVKAFGNPLFHIHGIIER